MNILVTGFISISADHRTVFDYISNLSNDKFWRKEINSTTMNSKPQINALAAENSYLSKRVPDNMLLLVCSEFVENKKVVYQTLPDSKFFLKSLRMVESVSENETKVTYTIAFDQRIVIHGLGFSLPTLLVQLVAKHDMKKYLAALKTLLENKHSIH